MKSQRGLAVQSYSVPWINDTWEKTCDNLLSTGNKPSLLLLNLEKNVAGACEKEKHGLSGNWKSPQRNGFVLSLTNFLSDSGKAA